ncbi:MAG TPA: SRPBCC family protein [Dehalococcoidia bacterium]|nr:SRPBCC family protein [Dehalococcoidia bacterium]
MRDDLAYGTMDQGADGRWRLHFKRVFPRPIDQVWRAVTEPAHLSHWFPTTIEGERAAGALLRFAFPGGQAAPFEGRMLAFDPPRLVEFLWGRDIVRIALRSVPEGTELTLTDVLEERGKGARDGAGWHVCLDGLAAHLSGSPEVRQEAIGWKEVHPLYVEKFGPEAATIGPPANLG